MHVGSTLPVAMPQPRAAPLPRDRRAAMVVNARSGAGLAASAEVLERLAAALRSAGYEFCTTPQPGDPLAAQVEAALRAGARTLFVLGGDGSVRAVAAATQGIDVTIGVLPAGTMNRLAERLGLPPDPERAALLLRRARAEQIAVGTVNDDIFLYQAVAGRVSRLVRFREMQRGAGLLGWLPILRVGIRAVLRPARRTLRLRGGRRVDVVVVTTSLPGAPPAFRAEAVRRLGLLGGLRQGWLWLRGRLDTAPEVEVLHGPRLAVAARQQQVRVTLDGEMRLMRPPLRFGLRPGTLKVLRPDDA